MVENLLQMLQGNVKEADQQPVSLGVIEPSSLQDHSFHLIMVIF